MAFGLRAYVVVVGVVVPCVCGGGVKVYKATGVGRCGGQVLTDAIPLRSDTLCAIFCGQKGGCAGFSYYGGQCVLHHTLSTPDGATGSKCYKYAGTKSKKEAGKAADTTFTTQAAPHPFNSTATTLSDTTTSASLSSTTSLSQTSLVTETTTTTTQPTTTTTTPETTREPTTTLETTTSQSATTTTQPASTTTTSEDTKTTREPTTATTPAETATTKPTTAQESTTTATATITTTTLQVTSTLLDEATTTATTTTTTTSPTTSSSTSTTTTPTTTTTTTATTTTVAPVMDLNNAYFKPVVGGYCSEDSGAVGVYKANQYTFNLLCLQPPWNLFFSVSGFTGSCTLMDLLTCMSKDCQAGSIIRGYEKTGTFSASYNGPCSSSFFSSVTALDTSDCHTVTNQDGETPSGSGSWLQWRICPSSDPAAFYVMTGAAFKKNDATNYDIISITCCRVKSLNG